MVHILKSCYIPILAAMLLMDATTGPIRYYLSSINLELLAYVPKLFALIYTLAALVILKHTPSVYCLFGLACGSVLIGLILQNSPLQIAFGLYVMAPLAFGLVSPFPSRQALKTLFYFMLLIWVTTIFGVWLDIFTDLPWKGAELEILGKSIEVSRAWGTFSFDRPAGFTKLSVSAAIYISISSILVASQITGKFKIVIFYCISLVTIAATTNKAAMLGYLLYPIFLMTSRNDSLYRWLLNGIALFTLILPVAAPYIRYNLNIEDIYTVIIFSSFEDRLLNTWPAFFTAMGFRPLGLGIGGFGSAVMQFGAGDAQKYLGVADSLPLYLIGWLGPVVGVVALFGFTNACLKISRRNEWEKCLASCGVFLLVLGSTTDSLEGILAAFVFGIVIKLSIFKIAKTPKNQVDRSRYDFPQSALLSGPVQNK